MLIFLKHLVVSSPPVILWCVFFFFLGGEGKGGHFLCATTARVKLFPQAGFILWSYI